MLLSPILWPNQHYYVWILYLFDIIHVCHRNDRGNGCSVAMRSEIVEKKEDVKLFLQFVLFGGISYSPTNGEKPINCARKKTEYVLSLCQVAVYASHSCGNDF